WFSQRTVHHFDYAENESGKSNFIVKVLTKDKLLILSQLFLLLKEI
ncbi:MAG: phycobiliprotein lyase, partial [Trichodesmium sp. St17_bin3_1_1]|nr:phycobiliprotein lyase [Trichodesmium sp. St17_bin3_1_1]